MTNYLKLGGFGFAKFDLDENGLSAPVKTYTRYYVAPEVL
jgi:hypothetical protein